MIQLSAHEQVYLLSAFADSPREWFRPASVGAADFSARQIDAIVENLARQGLMDAQPGCHARLTDQGRKHATRIRKLAGRGAHRGQHRHVIVAIIAAAALICLVTTFRVIGIF
jgi:hypothetical protein